MTGLRPGEVAVVTKGAEDDVGPSGGFQHTFMFAKRGPKSESPPQNPSSDELSRLLRHVFSVKFRCQCVRGSVVHVPKNRGPTPPPSSVEESTLHVGLV